MNEPLTRFKEWYKLLGWLFRVRLAKIVMWTVKPLLGPMLLDLDTAVTQLVKRKVERTDLFTDKGGVVHMK